MAGKKVGSDGQIRKTTTEWAADTDTYPEGMRLMDTDTGSVRVSKGTTYALAWQAASGGAATWGTITGTLSDQTDLRNQLETQANAIGAKADAVKLNGTTQDTAVIEVRTGTTDSNGSLIFDLSAYSSVTVIGGGCPDQAAFAPLVLDPALATYSLAFYDTTGAPIEGQSAYCSLLCIP